VRSNVAAALRSLGEHPLRTALTALGIIIGVASAVTLIAIGQGAKTQVTGQIESLGANLVIVLPGQVRGPAGFNPMSSIGISTLTMTDLAVVRRCPTVRAVAPVMFLAGGVRRGETWASVSIPMATTPELEEIRQLKLTEGRFLKPGDDTRAVCVLGLSLRKELFPSGPALGKQVAVNQSIYTVIGIATPKIAPSSFFGANDVDPVIYLPLRRTQEDTRSRQIHRIVAQVGSDEAPAAIIEDIRQAVKRNHGGVEDFTVLTPRDVLELFYRIMNLLTTVLVGISAISLVVGGIGIMNVMLASVTERTREIGIRKTVGARRRDIFLQFLIEGVLLAIVGGTAGLTLAWTACRVAAAYTALRPVITPGAVALSLGVCLGVGLLFGIVPAIRAARKNPIDALRYE
jgi:putative ABC transport system permease protein